MTPKEYPILYSTPMIQAILDGRKTQTRRIIKGDFYVENDPPLTAYIPDYITGEPQPVKLPCPYGQVGDFTWARETWQKIWDNKTIGKKGEFFLYRADYPDDEAKELKWKPSIFMPRAACRIVQENVDIRVERVADISEDDAIGEGIKGIKGLGVWQDYEYAASYYSDPIQSYKSLWNSINNVPKLNKKLDSYIVYPFDEQSAIKWGNTYRNKPLVVVANPWVWVIEF